MAKRKSHKRLSIKDILKGKFLVDENAYYNWRFFALVVFLALVMITSAHQTDKKVVQIEKRKEKLDEVKAKYALMQSRLIQMQLESELALQVSQDSLVSLEDHPVKIIVD